MGWKLISARGKRAMDRSFALDRVAGRCEGWPRHDRACVAPGVDVVEEDGRLTVFCRACRVAGVGLTLSERKVDLREAEARQVKLCS